MAENSQRVKYIYEIPYFERTTLCRILDYDEKWKELAGIHMKFSNLTIKDLEREVLRGGSSTDELLTKWGHQNHTVTELFVLLSRMQHYQAMMVLKPFVADEFHKLIYEGEENLSRFFGRPSRGREPSSPDTKSTAKSNRTEPHVENGAVGLTSNGLPGVVVSEKNMGISSINLDIKNNTASRSQNKMFLHDFTKEEKILNTEHNNQFSITNTVVNSKLGPGVSGVPKHHKSPGEKSLKAANENKDASTASQPRQNRRISIGSDASSVVENCGNIPQIEYKELMNATDGWDRSRIIGKGGFGTVYRGTWKNTLVAIKKIEQKGSDSGESYQAQMDLSLRELKILNSVRHDNVLPLYGYSIDGDEPCLVYQFMTNGSVEDRLICRGNSTPLTWQQRHDIAVGTARGLQFLHNRQKPFLHGDIKSANILLDSNFEPRIGDFGLAREGPQSHYTHMKVSRIHGTRPYLPDEFLRAKQMSTKVDTYSFGIVMFELATGLRAYDASRKHKFLKDHICECAESELLFLIDKKAGCEDLATFNSMICLGKHCISQRPKDRPEMEAVLKHLEGIGKRNEIISNGQLITKSPSPRPRNPYELQLVVDIESERRKQSVTATPTPTSTTSVPPPFCNGNTPLYTPVFCSPVQGKSNERYLPNYVNPNFGLHQLPTISPVMLPTNPFYNGRQEQFSLQREVDGEIPSVAAKTVITKNGCFSPGAAIDFTGKLSITIPNSDPKVGHHISPGNRLLQKVKTQSDYSSTCSSELSDSDSKEMSEINSNILPPTVIEEEHEELQFKDEAEFSPISDDPNDVPLLSLLGVKQSTCNIEEPDVTENHESTHCVSHHISFDDRPTAEGKEFKLFG